MKKHALLFLVAAFALTAQAQVKVGGNIGLPVGNGSDALSFNIGGDFYYLLGEEDGLFDYGLTAGLMHYSSKEVAGVSTYMNFVTVGGVARVNILRLFTLGPDIGYAIGINELAQNAFYWRGMVGITLLGHLELNLYYQCIVGDRANTTAIGLGVLFEF